MIARAKGAGEEEQERTTACVSPLPFEEVEYLHSKRLKRYSTSSNSMWAHARCSRGIAPVHFIHARC